MREIENLEANELIKITPIFCGQSDCSLLEEAKKNPDICKDCTSYLGFSFTKEKVKQPEWCNNFNNCLVKTLYVVSADVCSGCEFFTLVKSESLLTKEKVNHPSHYGGDTTYEVIRVIEAWKLNFNLGTAVKYIPRAGKKDPDTYIEDLEKSIWYIRREIQNEIQRRENEKKTD